MDRLDCDAMRRVGKVAAVVAAAVAGLGGAVLLRSRSRDRSRADTVAPPRRRSARVVSVLGRSVARTPGDPQLVEAVRAQLAGDFGDVATGLQVTAHRRIVTLRGEVTRLGDIDACEAAARAVAGVGDVNNLLRLAASRTVPQASPSPSR
jgi:osmotically-inducible protein OsmY